MTHRDRARAGAFGAVADAYDAARPRYPAALFDDLAGGRPLRALDVGCGTGILAEGLRAKGCDVLGVEPDPRMAAVARRKGIPVETARFETWLADGRRFDLVTSGQAWHWVDPVAGPAKAAAVLRPGGRIALVWNIGHHTPDVRGAMDAAYGEHAPQLRTSMAVLRPPMTSLPSDAEAVVRGGAFRAADVRAYPWKAVYTSAEWVAQIGTYSDHRLLPEAVRDALLGAVTAAIDALGGQIVVTYDTVVVSATRR